MDAFTDAAKASTSGGVVFTLLLADRAVSRWLL
jgi:hypothetical protein